MSFNGTMKSLERMRKVELAGWAEAHCLLEHLSGAEVGSLTKAALVDEVRSALRGIDYHLENAAAAEGTVRTKGDVWAHIGATW